MIKVSEESKIYVVCPYGKSSGGHETLHQLVSKLRDNKYNAYIYYFNVKKGEILNIHDKFKNYNIKYVTNIDDDEKNILVVPETFSELLYQYKNVKKCIWFLSLDFYFKKLNKNLVKAMLEKRNIPTYLNFFMKPLAYLILGLRKKNFKQLDFKKDRKINDYFYLYNCEYAKNFLINNGVKEKNTFYLCGPIRDEYIDTNKNEAIKENIVAYNPAKGYEFTKKIIKELQKKDAELKIIPIKNLTPSEIRNLLRKTKVYIDFGYFPGPERIPREAVCCYCNIVTSNLGSAQNDIDVPIPQEFKFDVKDNNIDKIVDKINFLLNNYNENVNKFNNYRGKVSDQKYLFQENICKIFEK